MDNLSKYSHPQTWEPSLVSPRVAAQHSQFLYSAVSTQSTGSLWLAEEEDALLAIAITPKLKKASRQILSKVFDIRPITLFPDIDGFADAQSVSIDQWGNERW